MPSVFKDDKGDIPTDEEAMEAWRSQPGMDPEHVLYFGRKDNFWEMADTGPCGPCSEIHYRPRAGSLQSTRRARACLPGQWRLHALP